MGQDRLMYCLIRSCHLCLLLKYSGLQLSAKDPEQLQHQLIVLSSLLAVAFAAIPSLLLRCCSQQYH